MGLVHKKCVQAASTDMTDMYGHAMSILRRERSRGMRSCSFALLLCFLLRNLPNSLVWSDCLLSTSDWTDVEKFIDGDELN
jgi:hypothetical protein